MASLAPLEIKALARIVDELDYYQLLHVERAASAAEIKTAYYQTSRTFHPDSNRHLEAELQAHCQQISKRLTEAYCVLRDARRRKVYDERLSGGGAARMQLAEAMQVHAKQETETRQGRTAQGRQLFSRAQADLARGNTAGAISNLQMALTFEPDNALFKAKLDELKPPPRSKR